MRQAAVRRAVLGMSGAEWPPASEPVSDTGAPERVSQAVLATHGAPMDLAASALRVEAFFPTDAQSEGILRSLARR
jgi:hypothetical protein